MRDLAYSTLLIAFFMTIPSMVDAVGAKWLYYPLVSLYGFSQGIVWTGLWVLAHECGHSAFTKYGVINDTIGWFLHSLLLTPYFSWKSTHRRHHIYANNMEKDHNYVPLRRLEYFAKLGLNPEQINMLTEDAPLPLFFRIVVQQTFGWSWYMLSNITCAPTAVVSPTKSAWRNSHFDPWGSLFRSSERLAVLLSDLGCLGTVVGLYRLIIRLGSWHQVFWLYVVPWAWLNHWIGENSSNNITATLTSYTVMITFLHHTHPSLPKFDSTDWDFLKGATATMDREFGLVGRHFFHRISSDHVTHHLFSKIPHYYARDATRAIAPLLGNQYRRGPFNWGQLKLAFSKCQWVEEDEQMDKHYLQLSREEKRCGGDVAHGLWYKAGPCPRPEYRQRAPSVVSREG